MTEISTSDHPQPAGGPYYNDYGTDSERKIVIAAYILHALGVLTAGVIAVIAVIVGHLKVNDTQSEFIREHHRWLLRTFWWGLFWWLVCAALTVIFIGLIGYGILAIWWIYRIVRGLLAFSERKPLPLPR
ncbi:hypothetical protein [Algiphilus sp.]|uniref:DUF4870 family protein n=1 Tax=Algiphilus sp. TaxID=1872431 RepID=UPI001CA6DB19|nr:hypothetical protein [Algiphilus sp.]MBY8965573.1 hypothetical protein [Algiphilus acroporae]MCI5062526.1 hypothetical protein [Algiphilus sp.]MCI5102680.1 hypothetical protein [Algiphilus sp.]MCR9090682.1 hypothetical protein [Pseudomonadota bacterium]